MHIRRLVVLGGLFMTGIEKAANVLLCQQVPVSLDFVNYDAYLEGFSSCAFPGIEVFQTVHGIVGLTKMIADHINELEKKFPSTSRDKVSFSKPVWKRFCSSWTTTGLSLSST